MTPAELKTVRESLGLTSQWLADQVGVKLRSVQYWESGRSPVPDDVAELVNRIDASINHAVRQAIDTVELAKEKYNQFPDMVSLVRYRTDNDLWAFRPDMQPLPVTTHAALLSRLRLELDRRSIQSKIVYMDPLPYKEWLGDRVDSESTRAEWAGLQD